MTTPLTALRIAVTCSHPGWKYLVSFDRKSEQRPTDAEAAMLASFLEEYKDYWYNERWVAKMAARALDVDGGANGVVFHKYGPNDWGYRRQSYERGWEFSVVPPQMRDNEQGNPARGPFDLEAIMDRMHSFTDGVSARWVTWKAEHPDVFGRMAT